jgi:hypothetical protein
MDAGSEALTDGAVSTQDPASAVEFSQALGEPNLLIASLIASLI